MANAWGENTWGIGDWGQQSDAVVSLSGQGLSMPTPSGAQFVPVDGWGRSSWGSLSWNANYENKTVSLTGLGLNSSLNNVGISGEINSGWGRLTFGENAWGIQGDVLITGIGLSTGIGTGSVTIDVQPGLTGEQLNLNTGTITAFGIAQVPVTGQGLTVSEGNVDAAPDAEITGSQVNIGQGSVTVTAEINQGWGRLTWGQNDWGTYTLSVNTELTGQQLNISQGNETAFTNVNIDINGNGLTLAEGTVDPSPDATVVGIGLSASVAVGSVIEADANLSVTGIALEIAQGQAELNAVTIAEPTGQQLNTSLNSAVAGASAEIFPTGIGLTATAGSINVQSWQIVDTGTNVNWNIIDTAA